VPGKRMHFIAAEEEPKRRRKIAGTLWTAHEPLVDRTHGDGERSVQEKGKGLRTLKCGVMVGARKWTWKKKIVNY